MSTAASEDRPREECGVAALISSGASVTGYIVDALHALQHRGQESAGLAVSDGRQMMVVKDMGLVAQVLTPATVGFLEGAVGVGHVRYSTTGDSSWENAQPHFCSGPSPGAEFALAHNGNITGVAKRSVSRGDGAEAVVLNDTAVVAEMVQGRMAAPRSMSLADAVAACARELSGAFSLVFAGHDCVIGLRDPNGFRPLCLGRTQDGWAIVSETAALDAIGADFVREIVPGEMVVINRGEAPRSFEVFARERVNPSLCALEFAYLARSDSYLSGVSVHSARMRMGETLARKAPVCADLVIGVPESGLPAAQGFAAESGIALGTGLVKNRYTGRSFINPTQSERDREVRRKLNVLPDQVRGKRLVVVDDSVVRGTVTRRMVALLYSAGAREVHLRIALPPVRWPCFYGIAIGSRDELLATGRTADQMREVIGVDSLAFLDVAEMQEAIGPGGVGLCMACMTGQYPTPVGAMEESGQQALAP